jgi:hypothetical protein
MLSSFSQSYDHPYSKSLSQTTIVGAHRGVGIKIHYVEFDVHNQERSRSAYKKILAIDDAMAAA